MKQMIKKTFAIFMTILMTMGMLMNNAFAANDFSKTQLGSKAKYSYGGAETGTVLYMTKGGEEVYCLEYNKTPANSYSKKDPNFLSQKKKDELGLINYYVHQDYAGRDAYAVTQTLVWRYMAGSVKSFIKVRGIAKTQSKGSYEAYFKQIMSKVKNFSTKPSFNNATKTIKAKQTTTFTDSNSVLSMFTVKSSKGATSSISGNTLSVTPDGSNNKVIVRLNKLVPSYKTGINVVWSNGSNKQRIGKLDNTMDPPAATVTLNVLPATGDLHVTKTDITKQKEIEGAVLRVTDVNGNKVDEWTSTKEVHVIKNLNSGAKYTLTEVKAPEGYKIADPITFVLDKDGKVTKVNMKDEREEINIHTTATDGQTKSHTGLVGKTTIIDKVAYTNLIRGKEYTVKGKLMDKKTNSSLLVDGKEVTAEKTFTATERNGFVELKYELDSSSLAGKTTVVFEDMYEENVKVASHTDINDEGQTVHYPSVHTTALDKASNSHQADVSHETTIIDKVAYTNLIVGKKYTVKGKLMNQSTGKALLDKNGKEITAEKTFTAEQANGTVDMTFTFDSFHLGYGVKTVVFEDLYEKGVKVATHADINDKGQTVEFKKLLTSIQVNKIDSMTKQIIKSKDFKFGIYSDEACTKLIKEVSADTATGTATFKDVEYGTYYIKEIAAPKGYKLSSEVIKVVVDEKLENVGKTYSISYMNTPLPAAAGRVKTGDENSIFGLIAMIIVSMSAIFFLIRRKKNNV